MEPFQITVAVLSMLTALITLTTAIVVLIAAAAIGRQLK